MCVKNINWPEWASNALFKELLTILSMSVNVHTMKWVLLAIRDQITGTCLHFSRLFLWFLPSCGGISGLDQQTFESQLSDTEVTSSRVRSDCHEIFEVWVVLYGKHLLLLGSLWSNSKLSAPVRVLQILLAEHFDCCLLQVRQLTDMSTELRPMIL